MDKLTDEEANDWFKQVMPTEPHPHLTAFLAEKLCGSPEEESDLNHVPRAMLEALSRLRVCMFALSQSAE